MKFTRRELIAGGLVATGLATLGYYSDLFADKAVAGEMQGASFEVGHKLRSGQFPEPARTLHKDVVIVGGGDCGFVRSLHTGQGRPA